MEMQELELTISAEEICRTCLAAADRTQLKPIFCNEILDGRIVPFPSVLELVIGEKIVKDAKLPNNVCSECKGKLRDLYLFVGMTQKSNKLLYEIFNVQPSRLANTIKHDTKHAESQTETLEKSVFNTLPKNVSMKEIGTQCANNTADMCCQTDAQYVLENAEIVPNEVVKIDENELITPIIIDDEEAKPTTENELFRESSIECTLMNFDDNADDEDDDDDDGENKYEMVLLANTETNTDECFTIRPVKVERKQQIDRSQMIISSTEPATTGSMPRTLLSKPTIDWEKKPVARQLRGKKAHCSYCNWNGRRAAVEQHFQVHKETFELCLDSNDYYRCSDCFTVFISQIHFIEHFSTSCNRVPADNYVYHPDLNKHESFYHNGLDICVPRLKTFKKIGNKYQCGRCIKHISNSFDAMRPHLLSHEAEDDKSDDVELLWKRNHLHKIHVCGICKVQFPDATYIRQHLYFHQDSFICIYGCGIIFVSFLEMTNHIESKHMQGRESIAEANVAEDSAPAENYQCTQCGKTLASAESLKNHIKNHTRRYVCTECNKCFGQKSDLTNHCRIHTDDRPYACKLCDKRFRTNSHVRDHMFTHENVNKYECDVCHKMFKAKRILAAHARLHGGDKPYQCKLCYKCFSRKQHLISHQKTHFKPSSSGTASKPEKATKRSP
ncbi:zinc finger protein 184-like [Anopheles maculipalpis]|uniref:zinc finger protein 184-like n=1 Tax=Anopheles maculipalpis TaxID=1496333 RepID=UPI002159A661|nr:zinc finger protein 184-like [Anopheles maculipalpis]